MSIRIECADVDLTIGDCLPDICIMKDADKGRAAKLSFRNELDHGLSVARIEAGCRLVEKKKLIGKDEAARNIYPLLFAATESQR